MELSTFGDDQAAGAARSLMKLDGLCVLAVRLDGFLGGRWRTSGTAYLLDV